MLTRKHPHAETLRAFTAIIFQQAAVAKQSHYVGQMLKVVHYKRWPMLNKDRVWLAKAEWCVLGQGFLLPPHTLQANCCRGYRCV